MSQYITTSPLRETFIDLMNWAERNKDEEMASKLRELHHLVCAATCFDMPNFP